jgi:hypothetical protein
MENFWAILGRKSRLKVNSIDRETRQGTISLVKELRKIWLSRGVARRMVLSRLKGKVAERRPIRVKRRRVVKYLLYRFLEKMAPSRTREKNR